MPLIPKDEIIEVPSVGGREPREVSRQILGRIIEPRMDEILGMACKEITRSGCEDILAAGVVLTGGTAILEGIPELAEQIFNMPVRRGCPDGHRGAHGRGQQPPVCDRRGTGALRKPEHRPGKTDPGGGKFHQSTVQETQTVGS